MTNYNNFVDFINNENPFAYIRDYDKNTFKEDSVKFRLEAIKKLQPKFIPCIVEDSVLVHERTVLINHVIRNGINDNIVKGISILNKYNIPHDIFQFKVMNTSNIVEMNAKAIDLQEIGFDPDFAKKHRFNMKALGYILDKFRPHIDLDDMEDVILNLCKLKLINEQKILRDKIYNAIKEKITDEDYLRINMEGKVTEDPIKEIEQLIEVEKTVDEKTLYTDL